MSRITPISRIPLDKSQRPATAHLPQDPLSRFQTCHFYATTKSGKKECCETFQSEKAAEKQ
jgi:hypothetical protein